MSTVVCFGDSITQGHIGYAYVDRLRSALPDVRIINAGIDGDTTLNLWKRIDQDVLTHRPDVVTIMVGLNDFGTRYGERLSRAYYRHVKKVPIQIDIATYAAMYRAIVARLRAAGCQVLVMTPTTLGEMPLTAGQAILDGYTDTVRQIAYQQELPLADVRQAFLRELHENPHVGQEYHLWMVPYDQFRIRWFGHSYDAIAQSRGQRLLVDGVHLSALGAQIVADTVLPVLQPLIGGS